MALIALVLGIAVGGYKMSFGEASLNHSIDQIINECSEIRKSSSCKGQAQRVWYDHEHLAVMSDVIVISLPEDISIQIGNDNIVERQENRDLFLFYPDGTAEKSDMIFQSGNQKIRLSLSPLTGRINRENLNEKKQ